MKQKDKKAGKKPTFDRILDRHFYELDQRIVQGNKVAYAILLAFLFFGVMGLIWMVPFPKLAFLERMHMQNFLNWGSFFIAIVIYLYLKLAPTLSYAMLFSIGIMSFFIVQLEYLQRNGGPAVWLVCLVFALIGGIGTFLHTKKEQPTLSLKEFWQLITIGPIWLWSKIFQRFNIKY